MNDYFEKLQRKVEHYQAKYNKEPRVVALKLAWWNLLCAMKTQESFNRLKEKDTSINIKTENNKINICFQLFGGLGDLIIARNYIYHLINFFNLPNITIYITGKTHILNALFLSEFKIIERYERHEDFDIFISMVRFPEIKYVNMNKKYTPAFYKFLEQCQNFRKMNSKLFDACPQNDGIANQICEILNKKRWQQPDILGLLAIDDLNCKPLNTYKNKDEILEKFGLNKKRYITINRGCEGSSGKFECTKMWPLINYNEYVQKLKEKMPDYIFVQVGDSDKKCKKIKNIDINLLGKTSLEEIKIVLQNAELHIDNEGGLVHMRHFLGAKPSIVLFGPTSLDFYGYPENLNIKNSSCNHSCEWLNNQWLNYCIKNHSVSSVCMNELTVSYVFDKTLEFLKENSYV